MSSVELRGRARGAPRASAACPASASSSVTALYTRSSRSPAPRLKSSGPSFAMHAWWTAAFSSAYGSAAHLLAARRSSRRGRASRVCARDGRAVPCSAPRAEREAPALCAAPPSAPASSARSASRVATIALREVASAARARTAGSPRLTHSWHRAVARQLDGRPYLQRRPRPRSSSGRRSCSPGS